MVPPSPTPRRIRPRWGRIAAWSGAVLGVVLVLGVAVLATAPRWGSGIVERELEQRLSRRLAVAVDIGELDLTWRHASLRNVELRGEGLSIDVDRVEVELDRGALWSARFEVTEAEAIGGQLDGSRAALEQLADRVRSFGDEDRSEGGSWLRRRTRLTPDALELRNFGFSLNQGARRATGKLAARVEPDERRVDLRLTSVAIDLGLGEDRLLRAATVHAAIEADPDQGVRFPLTIDLAGGATQVDQNIAVAGVHGSVQLLDAQASEIQVELAGGFSRAEAIDEVEGDLWSIAGRFARDFSTGNVAVDMQAFELGSVPEVLAALPLVESERATVGGHLELDFGEGVARIDGQLELAGLNVSHRLLAREVVRDVGFGLELQASFDPARRRLELTNLEIEREGVRLLAHGELIHTVEREHRRYRLDVSVPEVGCQQVLDAIPRELIPGLHGFALAGNFSAAVKLDADFADLDALVLDGKIDLDGCRVRETPALASAARLNSGFTHRVVMRDGRTRVLRLYPGSGSYTPLAATSRYMSEAVLTTEDGSFRRHDGFNTAQLEVALRRNLEEDEVRLGASTITMQMVKNVLLSHERTLSRKVQELFLTWWVEQALSKQRIMELYLNVIEFGPGVYGITNAARHYFGKHPGELTSLEAAFLTLMLPSPVRRHVQYCKGSLDDRFAAKLHTIHGLMRDRGRISEQEFAVYDVQPLVFDPIERGEPAACLAEIDALMAGTETQRAISGLLGDTFAADDAPESAAWLDRSDWGSDPTSPSWGVIPPLPSLDPALLLPDEPVDPERWRVPGQPVDRDPTNADAPGRPAMDDLTDDLTDDRIAEPGASDAA
ncbi:transglycosylase domain-containing protein [Nannocystaceae bacterium ST9]